MKFKDLEEGKKYETDSGTLYRIKEGGLYDVNSDRYTICSMKSIMNMNFTEVPSYVSWEEALKYMLKGGKARFGTGDGIYTFTNALKYTCKKYEMPVNIPLARYMLMNKWILL
ncbi:hypothetical protein CLTEP_02390 [Clostridium tepidiprofundi DSM 19306]|uniref:Uncharacterized protein n=1 Tax=Clostridium tepidiprofundi DSM 19306 TaxID=1121338 RepID=A0A151B7G4_9CLOT|nr:hypothetical protein [Clostridium tepidiprofundi]KYH35846.1 hypothetical protein CLTEP_02390 [Clostridium tepidiprofundi DSM 19306]